MDKKIKEHDKFMENKIQKIEKEIKTASSEKETNILTKKLDQLRIYNDESIRNFQHERLIHLIVTFFFAILWLISVIALFLLPNSTEGDNYQLLNMSVSLICLILFITESFYIRHYYRLENGTQKLYRFSEQIYKMLN